MLSNFLRLVALGLFAWLFYTQGYYNAFEELANARGRVGRITIVHLPTGAIEIEGDPIIANQIRQALLERHNLQPFLNWSKENTWMLRNYKEPRWSAP